MCKGSMSESFRSCVGGTFVLNHQSVIVAMDEALQPLEIASALEFYESIHGKFIISIH